MENWFSILISESYFCTFNANNNPCLTQRFICMHSCDQRHRHWFTSKRRPYVWSWWLRLLLTEQYLVWACLRSKIPMTFYLSKTAHSARHGSYSFNWVCNHTVRVWAHSKLTKSATYRLVHTIQFWSSYHFKFFGVWWKMLAFTR